MKSANNQQFSVVIAEDDPSVRKAVQRVLELEGYTVAAVNDGQAALDTILVKTPDAAVLDVSMPFLDGLSVCKELRRRGNRTPILLLTARHEVGDRVAGLDAGFRPRKMQLLQFVHQVTYLLHGVIAVTRWWRLQLKARSLRQTQSRSW